MNYKIKFLEDLNALLEKYNAEIEAESHEGIYGSSATITITYNNYQDSVSFVYCFDPDEIQEFVGRGYEDSYN